ncbi:hypothetical protein DB321_00620 [Ligilactobacillus salivarius]|uniref:Uncharacterized protein n=1 Tax=Ligilactobacillus salivarius TaxID=1624 RepID=A0ABD6XJV3_9LACO|nr:hypothetical protein DBP89_01135 [Ligilactobacillus salivarius]PTS04560.1 hypothetical protein DBP87_01630 [Ligilactobacillus salivarius]PTU89968.1 hypothetical protein DB322_00925 [Ligilactobacillus salivarius]PTU92617.1 hypothetical protein DB321_00620 [Ligilactobacillus salivarius]
MHHQNSLVLINCDNDTIIFRIFQLNNLVDNINSFYNLIDKYIRGCVNNWK